MRIGIGLALLGAISASLFQHVVAIAMGCFLLGGAMAIAAVAIQRQAGRLATGDSELRGIFSWIAIAPAISNVFSPVLSGLVIDTAGFGPAFALTVAMPLLALLGLFKIGREDKPEFVKRQTTRDAFRLLKIPEFRKLLIINIVTSSCWDVHMFVVPVIGHERALSASSIGLVLGAFSVASTLIRFLIARWSDRFDERKVLRTTILICFLTFALYAWLPGLWGLVLGSAVLGLALGAVQPMILSAVHRVTPSAQHGQALGLRMMIMNGVTVGMPIGFGVLASASVTMAPMWLMAMVLFVLRFRV
jgi:MFS family permease